MYKFNITEKLKHWQILLDYRNSNLLFFKSKILTTLDFDVTQLSIHGKVLQIHRTRCSDG